MKEEIAFTIINGVRHLQFVYSTTHRRIRDSRRKNKEQLQMRKKVHEMELLLFLFYVSKLQVHKGVAQERKLRSIKSYTECYGTHFKLNCIERYDSSSRHLCRHKNKNILILS